MHVLVKGERIPIPEGWMVVMTGFLDDGDRIWNDTIREWEDAEWFRPVQDHRCVIRRDIQPEDGT